jgi:hypothetical protein
MISAINVPPYRFLINMFYAFSDLENLYLVTDLVVGGDMRYHLSK